jgi:excinuclease ABC subunit C
LEKPDLNKIPLTPGVYIFKSGAGRVLYVGKAKRLRKRLASYFREASALPAKTRAMLEKASELETISTATENEALLLEASLIKKHRPHYNILLRDDKAYVLFRLDTQVPYPRLEVVRPIRDGRKVRQTAESRPVSDTHQTSRTGEASPSRPAQPTRSGKPRRDKTKMFGPYTSGRDARLTWKAIHKIFPLRRCSDRAMKNRQRPCLYHHMGQCPAPCVLAVDQDEYAATVGKVLLLLQGRSHELLRSLRSEMEAASEKLEFEKAARLRDQLRAVENTVEKQSVLLEWEKDVDFLGLTETEAGLGLGLLFVRGGALLGSRSFFWPGLGLEDAGELLSSFLLQYYTTSETMPERVVLPWNPQDNEISELPALESLLAELHGRSVRIDTPRAENEERLVNLASTNAKEAAKLRGTQNMPAMLSAVFARSEPVDRIECVDISHISGNSVRAAMVVFEGGQPLREAWRAYNLEAIFTAGDDYAALAAWAERRARSGPPWPDLLLIDGGRGQLAAVARIFRELGVWSDQPEQENGFALASIAKARDEAGHTDRRAGNLEDRIFVPGRSNALNLKPGSPELLFLQHVRNHAHDFALGRHRQARSKQALAGELNRIPGFGPRLARALWEKFNSLQEMSQASDEELRQVPGLGAGRIAALRAHLALILTDA